MSLKPLTVRCSDEELERFDEIKKRTNLTGSELGRLFIQQGLSGLDKNHEELVTRLMRLEDLIKSNIAISSACLAAAAMLVDRGEGSAEEAKVLIKRQIKSAWGVGGSIRKLLEDGELG